jgi:DNA-binding transcriptional regulator GbsR (MarR family)
MLVSKGALAFENWNTHNKAMKKSMTLNAAQLELLRDFTNFPVLQIFMEPHNPSQVAKGLKMPANSMHYRVKKLYEAGLLKVVEQKGRRRSYQSVAANFRVRRDLMQRLNDSHGFTNDALTKLAKGYDTALEEHIEKHTKDSDDTGYIHFGIDDSERVMASYEPCLGLFETSLSQEQYFKLTKALLDIASETTKQSAKGKHCTVAIIAFAKSSAFPTLS